MSQNLAIAILKLLPTDSYMVAAMNADDLELCLADKPKPGIAKLVYRVFNGTTCYTGIGAAAHCDFLAHLIRYQISAEHGIHTIIHFRESYWSDIEANARNEILEETEQPWLKT